MDKKYEVLEYHKVINNLIDKANLEITKEKFLDLEIFKSKSDLDKELTLLRDFIDFYKFDGGLELINISNITKMLNTISLFGNYLEKEDLFELYKNILCYRICKSRAKNVKEKYKSIWNIFQDSIDLKEIEKYIAEILDDNGEIKDDASLNLRDIRKQQNIIYLNINEKLEKYIVDKETSRAIQEKMIVKRNDRYVLAIKTDFKGLIKGIEHDRSSSGQTSFIEPLNVVSLNNKLKEYQSREREEIRKILLRITEILRKNLDDLNVVKDILERLDFLNAKVLYALETDSNVVKVSSSNQLHLIDARHPFIAKDKVVPITFKLSEDDKIMLITGPNTGGKTVTLKIAGLFTLMVLSGLAIPANENSIIGMFDDVFSDIGDEQSIEQNLSSFSSHVSSISYILNNMTNKSLVLLDELGSGTDPVEGSAFAMAILDYILNFKTKAIITTHYSQVKVFAYSNPLIKSASMEFDLATLSPTYKLLVGIPGESNALIIASKYGINEDIINKAKSFISDDSKKIEKMISSIKEKNDILEQKEIELESLKEELSRERKEYEKNIQDLELEKTKILENAYLQADEYVKNIQNKAKSLIDKINSENAEKEEAKKLQKNINMLRNFIKEEQKEKVKKVEIKDVDFKVNDEVLVKNLNQIGKVLNINYSKRILQVQAGILKLTANFDDVKKIENKKKNKTVNTAKTVFSQVKGEVDVRGKNAEDAINEIETYFNRAILNGYTDVYVIHGKGTMILRKKIHEYLKKSIYVKEFKNGMPNEGGLGVTIVTLK